MERKNIFVLDFFITITVAINAVELLLCIFTEQLERLQSNLKVTPYYTTSMTSSNIMAIKQIKYTMTMQQLYSPYYQTFFKSNSPKLLSTPLRQSEAKDLLLKEMNFVVHKNPAQQSTLDALQRKIKGKSRGATTAKMYSEEQVLPLVIREVSALARQRIKVREPTDFLKVQQRIKTDLEGMNHTNAFFRQRYSAYIDAQSQAATPSISTASPARQTASSSCYRPRPFVDHRGGCLANYDEYLMMRDLDNSKKQLLKGYLNEQIKHKHTITVAAERSVPSSSVGGSRAKLINLEGEVRQRQLIDQREDQKLLSSINYSPKREPFSSLYSPLQQTVNSRVQTTTRPIPVQARKEQTSWHFEMIKQKLSAYWILIISVNIICITKNIFVGQAGPE